jgi:membrane protease YdiL (CAAX protease family)
MPTTSSAISPRLSNGSRQAVVVAWLGVAALLIALAFVATSSGETDRNAFYKYSLAAGSAVAYSILIAATLLIARWLGRPLAALGLTTLPWRWFAAAVGVILLVIAFGAALEPILHAGEKQGLEPKSWDPDRAGAYALNAALAATLVPFAEELFFRGLGIRALLRFGGLAAISVTALAFGLGHGIAVALPVLVAFGAGLGWVRLRSGSLWPGVIAHGLYNGSLLLYVYFKLT